MSVEGISPRLTEHDEERIQVYEMDLIENVYVCKSNVGTRSAWIIPFENPREVPVLEFDVLGSMMPLYFYYYLLGGMRNR